jgi:hypothetical protein
MKRQEILAVCLADIQNGKRTLEDCINLHPDLEKDLHSLLKIATALEPDTVSPSADFKQRTLHRLFEEMQAPAPRLSHRWLSWRELTPVRVVASVLAGVLILGVVGGTTLYASRNSLPGDTLYSVKTTVENFQLAVTSGTEARADLRITLVRRRIDEAVQQVKKNRNIDAQALQTVEKQLDNTLKELKNSHDTKSTNDVLSRLSVATLNQELELEQVIADFQQEDQPALKQALGVTRRGNLIAQVAYANHDFLERQPSVSDQTLEEHQFKINGTLLSISGRTWNVGGVIIQNVYLSGNVPAIGNHVNLEGVVKDDEVFISQIAVSQISNQSTTVEGQFGGNNQNGTSSVGGISVEISDDNIAQLQPGDEVQLKGDHDDGKLNVTNKENKQDENKDTAKLSGVLTGVDVKLSMITIESAGRQISVNVGEAQIESDNKRNLNLSDLNHLVGNHSVLTGLYKKDGLMYAHFMRVEIADGSDGASGSSDEAGNPDQSSASDED